MQPIVFSGYCSLSFTLCFQPVLLYAPKSGEAQSSVAALRHPFRLMLARSVWCTVQLRSSRLVVTLPDGQGSK